MESENNNKILQKEENLNIEINQNLIYSNEQGKKEKIDKDKIEEKENKITLKKFDEKLFSCLNNTFFPKEISDESFDTKFNNLRMCLEEVKVDWRDAHCDLKISRGNMLEDTLEKIILLDPYKVRISLNCFKFFV